MVEFCFFGDSVQIVSRTSNDGDGALVHWEFDEGIENVAERAMAGLGGCRNGSLRTIAATRSDRQIVKKRGIGPRNGWAPCGAECLCKYILFGRCFLSGGRAGSLRAPLCDAQYLSGILKKKQIV